MTNARIEDIAKRYQIKSDKAYRTYQETGQRIYDWFYREYDDIATLARECLSVNETANNLVQMRVFLSEFVERLIRSQPDDLEQLKKDVQAYARLCGIR